MQGSRHVPAPVNTPSLPEGEAAEPGRCGTLEMAARWQQPNPSTCPGLCPKSALAGRGTEQGAVLEVRASSVQL